MSKKDCKHNGLIQRLQKQGQYGQQRGYCSQQCKKLVDVFVPNPDEVDLSQCPHCLCMTKTIAGKCLKCKKDK